MKPRVGLLVAIAFGAGCFFPSLDNIVADASTDVTNDASSDTAVDASKADGEAGVVPIATDDFEQGCGDWVAQNGTFEPTTAMHGGKNACMACKSNGGSYFTIDHGGNTFAPIQVGRTYTGTVWARVAPQTTNTNLFTVNVLRTVDSVGGFAEQGPYVGVPIDQNWQLLSTTMTVDAGVTISGYVGLDNYNDGDCFIIDDYALYEGDGG